MQIKVYGLDEDLVVAWRREFKFKPLPEGFEVSLTIRGGDVSAGLAGGAQAVRAEVLVGFHGVSPVVARGVSLDWRDHSRGLARCQP